MSRLKLKVKFPVENPDYSKLMNMDCFPLKIKPGITSDDGWTTVSLRFYDEDHAWEWWTAAWDDPNLPFTIKGLLPPIEEDDAQKALHVINTNVALFNGYLSKSSVIRGTTEM